MGRKKKVIPIAEPPLADEEGSGGGLDLEEEEDSGRGLLVAVNKHVVNEDEDDEDEEDEEDDGAPKQREGLRHMSTLRWHCRAISV